ncbi:AAA family ATPase [Paraglaciecola aquimarina]|uniref:AAA family ATPase n=1 Tax=Paraglaciecola algarum TaxID=3050085 RepID=A0ABS9D528_9ALTE|nr:AAA family ATPase [Paraglaciecola sp. G1-23]MCF2948048.1 AAA family ATPase [Paraglaciecola sp. G1-23]
MKKIIIFGNSGAGKSTLAKQLSSQHNLAHLDLDTLAWQPSAPPTRKPIVESAESISHFIKENQTWVIEGCYADLIEIALPFSNEIIFLNLPLGLCIENARKRPWEPHKYESKAAQDKNLDMLIEWISQYSSRTDTFSEAAHTQLYQTYSGKKQLITSNQGAI